MPDQQFEELELYLQDLKLDDLVTHASLVCLPASLSGCLPASLPVLPSLEPPTVTTGSKSPFIMECLHLSKQQLEDMVNYGSLCSANDVSAYKADIQTSSQLFGIFSAFYSQNIHMDTPNDSLC